MSDQEYSSEYGSENSYGTDTSAKSKEGLTAVKERVSEQANEIKGKLKEQASSLGNQLGQKIDSARGKTSAQLRNTSQRIGHWASYVESKDAKDMSDDLLRSSRELIRQHPGKSLIIGLLAGIFLGRLLSGERAPRYPLFRAFQNSGN
ncbi:DUF883 family protein [Vampirovibrio chlorellavorus]|uniref:DUF883 family protein n=1 Tax=Vampirovibrio chlorellavorus TaxID=758823 RepID=UPI0026F24259|nr:hypothetical protein [Vampirovibrio chlorellavorus]